MKTAAILGHWSGGNGPLYRQLADRISQLVSDGELRPEELLPPERTLASELAVSRSTTVAAYALLQERGVVTRRQGSGTRIAATTTVPDGARLIGPGVNDTFRQMLSTNPDEDVIDLGSVALPVAPEVRQVLGNLAGPDLDDLLATSGYHAYGYLPLRRALAASSNTYVPTDVDNILVTNGAQQAISLVTAQLVRQGDAVITEEATFGGALDAFRVAGARLFAARSDRDGVVPEDLEQLVARVRPALVYLTPTYNNPTGTVLPTARRAAVVDIARRYHVPVIDDLALSYLHLDPDAENPPGLALFAENGPDRTDLVISIDSLDKAFWGGLRVGWIRASAGMINRLARAKTVQDLSSTPITQLAAARLLPDAFPIMERRNAIIRESYRETTAALADLLPQWSYQPPRGGAVLWLRLPRGSARGFAALALRYGVMVAAGPSFSPVETFADHIRLPFCRPVDVQLEGIRRLAAAWAAYDPAGDAERVPATPLL